MPSDGELTSALDTSFGASVLYDEFGRFMCDIGNIITKRRTHPSGLMCLSARAPLFVLCVLFYLIYPRRVRRELPGNDGGSSKKSGERESE